MTDDLQKDPLDEDLLALFRAEQGLLPTEPFMSQMQARLQADTLAAMALAAQQEYRRQLVAAVVKSSMVLVLAALLQPVLNAVISELDKLLTVVPLASLIESVNQPVSLIVMTLFAAVLAYCFRYRLQRFL